MMNKTLSQTSSKNSYIADSFLTNNQEEIDPLEDYYAFLNNDNALIVDPFIPEPVQPVIGINVPLNQEDPMEEILPSDPLVTNKRFQVHAKSLHVTYKGHLDLQPLLNFVIQQLSLGMENLVWYSVVQEVGTSLLLPYNHTHLAFKAKSQVSFTSQKKLDYQGIHPNIKVIKTQLQEERVWIYHGKSPINRIKSLYGPCKDKEFYSAIQSAQSLVDACILAGVEPKTVSDIFMIRSQRTVQKVVYKKYELSSFRFQLEDISKTVWLHGPSGIGKTEWAIAQLEPACLVRHTEDLKQYSPNLHRGIVFDDFALERMDVSTIIHLFDQSRPSTINVKHGSVQVPEQTPKIFTSNRNLEILLSGLNPMPEPDQVAAVLRRVYVLRVDNNLFL
jgi:hypothetical protein